MSGTGEPTGVGASPDTRAWLAWGAASLFFFHVFALRVSPSVMVEELMADFSVGAALLGNLSAAYFYTYAALQIPAGVLMERFGPRRLLSVSALLCALGCLLFALAADVGIAYLGRALIGAGGAFGWVGALTIVAWYFPPTRFAVLAAGTQLTGMLGGVVGQAPLEAVVSGLGWRTTVGGFAAAVALSAVLLWLVLRPAGGARAGSEASLWQSLRSAAGNRQTWLNAATGFCYAAPLLAFAGLWSVPFLTSSYAMERNAAAALTSVLFVGWGLGGVTIGYLSDRSQRRRPFVVGGGIAQFAALLLIVYAPGLPAALLALAYLVAGVGGSTMVLAFARVRDQNDPHARGAAMGMVNTAVICSGVVLQPAIGALLDLNWSGVTSAGVRVYAAETYRVAFWVLPLGCALGVLCAWQAREGRPR